MIFNAKQQEVVFPVDPTRHGYLFDGWFDAKEGGNKVESLKSSEDKTLYAHWTKLTTESEGQKPEINNPEQNMLNKDTSKSEGVQMGDFASVFAGITAITAGSGAAVMALMRKKYRK